MLKNIDDVKVINQERLRENNREKAEKYKAQQDADAANGWSRFKSEFCGSGAVARGEIYYDCQSNKDLIELFLAEEELPLQYDTIVWAFRENFNRLAKVAKTSYQRKTNVAESRIAPQQRSFAPAGKVAPYTRDEILSFSPSQLRAALRKYTAPELNRILSSN